MDLTAYQGSLLQAEKAIAAMKTFGRRILAVAEAELIKA